MSNCITSFNGEVYSAVKITEYTVQLYSTRQNKGYTAYVTRLLMSVCTEWRVRVISTPASYWGCPGFIVSTRRPQLTEAFNSFLILSRQMFGYFN